MTIEVVSVTPRVFRIADFLSDFEADYIIEQCVLSPTFHRNPWSFSQFYFMYRVALTWVSGFSKD